MNWKQIIKDLQNADFSQMAIADECGCGQATISELARGVNERPSYPIGAALVSLHKRVMRAVAKKEVKAV